MNYKNLETEPIDRWRGCRWPSLSPQPAQRQHQELETSSFLYAFIELLSEQGLITIEELDERKRVVREGLGDIREGIVRWDMGRPYLIAHNGDGHCCYLDCTMQACAIWEHRAMPCWAFDCRQDKPIWLNFENMIINSDINRAD